jgi:LuxR family quorum sensing-dependent transcriptional regulator
MGDIKRIAFDSVERLRKCTSIEEVTAELWHVSSSFGYESFCISELPLPSQSLQECILLCGWPEGWLDRYVAADYVNFDPVARKLRQATMPFFWSEARYDKEDVNASRIMNEARDFGLAEGLAVPIYSLQGTQATVTFGAPRFDLSEHSRAALHLIAIYAHGCIGSIRNDPDRHRGSGPRLSPREIECLKWIADGKTTWEISVILSLSERTVREYVDSASKKLGATNRPHAVAAALRRAVIL